MRQTSQAGQISPKWRWLGLKDLPLQSCEEVVDIGDSKGFIQNECGPCFFFISEYLTLCTKPPLTHLLFRLLCRPCLWTQALPTRPWATDFLKRKVFWTMWYVPNVRYLDFMDSSRHTTTRSTWKWMMNTKLPSSWSHYCNTSRMESWGFPGLNVTETWLNGPTVYWKNWTLLLEIK